MGVVTAGARDAAGVVANPVWSVPLATRGGGILTVNPQDGCIATLAEWVVAVRSNGDVAWQTQTLGRGSGGEPVISQGAFLRIEAAFLISRDLSTGGTIASFPAPLSSGLSVAPWGDLLYSQADPHGVGVLHCVDRNGLNRWSVPLDGSGPLIYQPTLLGGLVVVDRRGLLWAYDRDGGARWVADRDGVRHPRPEDDASRPTNGPDAGIRFATLPAPIDTDRAVVYLDWYSGRGLYLLDASAPALTQVAVASPSLPPYVTVPGAEAGYRIVGLGGRVEVAEHEWEYPVVAMEPDGRRLWEHLFPAKPRGLMSAPDGGVVVALSPTIKRWRDYHKWYDLSGETFVRYLNPDGTARWTWHLPGPLTHEPVVGADGIVYVGSEGRLWALPAG